MFAEATDWKMPWLPRALPNILAATAARPEKTLFTRFIPARKPGQGACTWRHYYERWGSMTIDIIGPDGGIGTRPREVRSRGPQLRQTCLFAVDRLRSSPAAMQRWHRYGHHHWQRDGCVRAGDHAWRYRGCPTGPAHNATPRKTKSQVWLGYVKSSCYSLPAHRHITNPQRGPLWGPTGPRLAR